MTVKLLVANLNNVVYIIYFYKISFYEINKKKKLYKHAYLRYYFQNKKIKLNNLFHIREIDGESYNARIRFYIQNLNKLRLLDTGLLDVLL